VPATPRSEREVLDALDASHPEWPHSEGQDTVNGDPWPLAWEATAFIEEWFEHESHHNLEGCVQHLPLSPPDFGYTVARSHHNTKPPEAMLKAHLIRIIKGWGSETKLLEYLNKKPFLTAGLGFAEAPTQSTLWKAWNKRLDDGHQEVLRTIAQVMVDVAREHDVPAPDEVFVPDPDVETDGGVEPDSTAAKNRAIPKTKDIWKTAKPFVCECFELLRGENYEVHENSWWEAHAFMGSREEMYAEDGMRCFESDTTRERVQSGSNHRYQLQKMKVDEARRMHRRTVAKLIERARQDSKMGGDFVVAIDITKSNPYRTGEKLEFDDDDECTNDWLLGYKNDQYDEAQYYFQWASIQIVGFDVPLVLDAVPVKRGMPRWKIVDELLDKATDLVDISHVTMDREYAPDDVKTACEEHGVYYLNPAPMNTSEKATCSRLRDQGKQVHVVEQQTLDENLPSRKRVYVPAVNAELTGDDGGDHDDPDDDDGEDEKTFRQGLVDDFADVVGEDEESVGEMFSDVVEEVREEEEEKDLPGNSADTQYYMLFETNDPRISSPDSDVSETEKAHMVSRVVRLYKHRWGIENGFKQIKNFRVRTTSMDHEYRFFNFLFASTLYNVWRLVDLLVKQELLAEEDIEYAPLVSADLFLTIAKQCIGLDPPD